MPVEYRGAPRASMVLVRVYNRVAWSGTLDVPDAHLDTMPELATQRQLED